jgi:predicted Zn-dependent peptidase
MTTHNEPNINYNIIKKKPNITIIPNEKNNQSYIFISFYFNSINFQQECILKFLSDYLSSGSTSKLFDVLRIKLGAIYSNETDFSVFSEKNGIFHIVCNVNNSMILESVKEILKIIQDLKTTFISNDEITKVKKIFETSNLFQINNPNFIMKYHAKKYLFDKQDNIYDEIKNVKNINPKMINQFCNEFFIRNNLNLYIYGNSLNQSDLAKIINEF